MSQTMIKTQKKELRRFVRGCVLAISQSELKRRSERLVERILGLEDYRKARTVALYWSLPGEVATHELVRRALADKRVVLPVVTGESMHFAVVAPDMSNLVEGAFGVPGMAFDRDGGRLGHGKGYYDRYFELYTGVTVGVCFDFQIVDRVPCEPFDRRVDMVVSE